MPDRTPVAREPGDGATPAGASASTPRARFRLSPDFEAGALIVGGSVLVLFGAVFVSAIAGFAVGLELGARVVVPAVAAQIGFVLFAWRAVDRGSATRRTVETIVAVGVVLTGLGLLAADVGDTSIDGRHYQGESIYALVDGWNPIRDPALRLPPGNPEIWTNSYPKATWVLEATVMKVGGDFESSKLVGPALLAAAALIAFAALAEAGLHRAAAAAVALVLALNPVATFELGTHMVDGIMTSLLLATIALTFSWLGNGPRPAVMAPLLLGVVLLVNTKFTGAVFAVIILGGTVLLGAWAQRIGWRKLGTHLGLLAATVVVGVGLFGFNPYVTNTLRHDGPFYPVLGPHSRDITRPFVVGSIQDQSSLERLARSVAAKSQLVGGNPELKLPLRVSASEWSAFRGTGVRFGGFGPLFSGALVFAAAGAIALMGLVFFRRTRVPTAAWVILGAAGSSLVSVLVMPDSFIARFAPQLWFVPALGFAAFLLATALTAPRAPRVPRVLAGIAWIGLVVMLVNAIGVAGSSLRWDARDSDRQEASLARLRAAPAGYDVEFGVWREAEARRLRDAGISFRRVPQTLCAGPLWLGIEGSLTEISAFAVKRPIQGAMLCPRL